MNISVIIPIFKSEKYIAKCIQSIVIQEFKNFEVLLIDNNSNDNSLKIACAILEKTDIEYSIFKETIQSAAAARNCGIAHSKYEWITFIDADDIIDKNHFQYLVKSIQDNTGIDIVFGNYCLAREEIIHKEKVLYKSRIIDKKIFLKKFLRHSINLIIPSMLVRKEFLLKNNLLFEQKILLGEDGVFIWRILLSVDTIIYLDSKTYFYIIRENSLTTNPNLDKAITNINAYAKLRNELVDTNFSRLGEKIYARAVFAIIRISAVYSEELKFMEFFKIFFTQQVYSNLLEFPDVRIKVLVRLLKSHPKAFFLIFHNRR